VHGAARKERPSGEQGLQPEPRVVEEASNKLFSAKVSEETEAHFPNGQAQGGHATEKVNGSAFNDKGKKSRGEPPFTKQDREEMETLLGDLCGHLGQFLWVQLPRRRLLIHTSHLSNSILARGRCCK
jgi:phospholipase D1/2